jgi:hypothetical protein
MSPHIHNWRLSFTGKQGDKEISYYHCVDDDCDDEKEEEGVEPQQPKNNLGSKYGI